MTPAELQVRAEAMAEELGEPPEDGSERAEWNEERRGAAELLAALADYDADALRQARMLVVPEHAVARDLLEAASAVQA
jgi:hypothetical protein